MTDHPEEASKLGLYQQLSEIRLRIEDLTAEETHVSRRVAGGVDGADLTLAQVKSDVEALYRMRDQLVSAISYSDSLERGRSFESG